MELAPVLAAIEALLFVASEPLSAEQLARVLGVPEGVVRSALERLMVTYQADDRGLELIEVAGGWQLVTKARFARAVEQLLQPRRPGLSRAALEILAIIAYRQPITRAEIETIRGVQSEAGLRTLLDRGLIREMGRKDAPGRPILYGTTPLFLRHFGLRDLSDLPPPERFQHAGTPAPVSDDSSAPAAADPDSPSGNTPAPAAGSGGASAGDGGAPSSP